jgi:prepilin-type N-terminal cleavage/methylation domain-containing protein
VRLPRAASVLVSMAAPLALVHGLFTTTRIFYVRDLSFFFWSRHLWLRHTLFAGQAPWWDPYVAGGQSAIADALNQLVMPITLAVRLLPSDVVSFNLWVALPLPLAALGTYIFLRRYLLDEGAAVFGALVFALSGPIVSMLNLPNLAWSVALMPWVLAGESANWIAIAFGLQALCGEPVTWVATGVIAALWNLHQRRVRPLAGLGLGALLASVQLIPTMMAGVRAQRAALATPDFWSLHPLSLWEAIAPHLFGDYYHAFLDDLPWMSALNFGRDPFFYSFYVGPFVLLLACAAARRRRNAFWVGLAIAFTVAALGGYTPAYPLVRRLVPALMYFRFPVKYIVFAVFAAAVLAADGWRERRGAWWLAVLAGAVFVTSGLALMAMPATLQALTYRLAVDTHLKEIDAGAAYLARVAPALALRVGGLSIAAALLGFAARRWPRVWWLIAGVTCADLVVANIGLNPTFDVARLSPPAWFTAAAGKDRVYIGGRVRGYMNPDDPDAAPTWQIPAEGTAMQGRMELNASLPMAPSGWRVREALSYDLPSLWPAEYDAAVRRFENAGPAERDAFLRRTGVRWCVLAVTRQAYDGQSSWRTVADVPDWTMRVYECHPEATRVAFAAEARDLGGLFDLGLPDSEPAGEARLVQDLPSQVTVEATLTRPSLLVLRDSYSDDWHVDVDGQPATLVRANSLQRGVPLPPGRHLVRFTYRPRDFLIGLILSSVAIIGIGFTGFAVRGRKNRERAEPEPMNPKNPQNPQNPQNPENPKNPENLPSRPDRGFTLIELMVVLAIIAIVLAIAFAEYRNLQARGNEASALSSMRSIAAAQAQFAMTCGNSKYAAALPALGQPVPTTGAAFLSPDLTSAETIEKSGYRIRMAGKPLNDAMPACNGAVVAGGYAATADPLTPGTTGTLFYGVNADRVLYVDDQKPFHDDLPESGPAPHGHEVK